MINGLFILLIVFFIIGKLCWNFGRKKGRTEGNIESYNEGYKNGINKIEDEVRELAKLPNKEILKRIKNFIKKEKE